MKDTESIVAKAIRDGGIDAVIDHANGWMLSKEIANIYTTSEPAAAFHARTAFCLDIHNEVHFAPSAHEENSLGVAIRSAHDPVPASAQGCQ